MKTNLGRGLTVGIVVLAAGVVLLVVSLVLAFAVFPPMVKNLIAESVRLVNGTSQWERFETIPFPLDFKVYIFDVVNPEDIINGEKPFLREVGPYVYNQSRSKTSITLEDDDEKVSFYQYQHYDFNSEMSGNLTEDDEVTVLNVPMLELMHTSENLPNLGIDIEGAIEQVFENSNLFIKTKIKNLLFDGIKMCDPERTQLSGKIICLVMMLMNLKNMQYNDDGSINFSLFNYRKDNHDGFYKIFTGTGNVEDLAEITEWNNSPYMSYWGNEENDCNKVHGLESTIFPPYNTKDTSFSIFSTDICRVTQLYYSKEITYKDVPGYRYTPSTNVFREENPEDSCYCLKGTRDENGELSCFLDGVMDLKSCLGVPGLLSLPHFLHADEKYRNAIDGLSPSEDDHTMFVHIEPNTGTPLEGGKRVQINFVMRPLTYYDGEYNFTVTTNVRKAVFPVTWINEGVSLPDKYVDELNSMYFNQIKLLSAVQWTLIGVFAVWTVVSGGYVVYKFKNRS